MKNKITILSAAVAILFSSCSKETYYFGFQKSKPSYEKSEAAFGTETQEKAVAITADFPSAKPADDKTATASTITTPATAARSSEVEKISAAIEASAPVESSITPTQARKEFKKLAKEVKKEVKKEAATSSNGKSQLIALILVILVGVLGIHRFYLGYTGIGIIQLLTLGGCGIWSLIDLIRIATGDLKPKDGDYTETL